ncbi:hypothetical protein [Cohnella sp. WQ 127256]|uniref:hypothetical protein n=1 Tax=Cohnella sp. WQ 127256 TaxID=2938790 RepID=UPI00211886C0|nr:hypothetical protein [Cohnella sp. WQ 127256]
MKALRTIYHIARADFLERVRQFSFLVILGLNMLAAYFFVPPSDAGYVTLYMDEYRGIYNSAWVGGSVAISTTLFLTLFGFYLVKSSIQRDDRNKVGPIIAATPVEKLHYLLGKACSNYTVLFTIVSVIMLMSLTMQLVRGEVMQVELWPLLSPFLLLTLPFMFVVAALAVLFESLKVLRGMLGNVIFFILFIGFSSSSSLFGFGTDVITSDMRNKLALLHPDYSGDYGSGILILDKPLKLFEWNGVDWTSGLILQQLLLIPAAFVFVVLAALLFRGFRGSSFSAGSGGDAAVKRQSVNISDDTVTATTTSASASSTESERTMLRATSLAPVQLQNSIVPLIRAELRLMMKSVSLGWFVIAAILAVLCLVLPFTVSMNWIWAMTWIWPIVLWSEMGSREVRFRTHTLVASSPRFVSRQLLAVWIAGLMLTGLTGSGMLIRLLLEGDTETLIYWLSAVIFIPSLALAAGVLTHTKRTFEVLYMILWYLGPFNKMPLLNFLGGESSSWVKGTLYILISIGFLLITFQARRRLAQNG